MINIKFVINKNYVKIVITNIFNKFISLFLFLIFVYLDATGFYMAKKKS